jgi:hypothetical protein
MLTPGETHRLGRAGEPAQATVPAPGTAHPATLEATTDTLVAALRKELADMRQDRDHWRGMAEAITRQIAEATTRRIIDQRGQRPWWKRLVG